MKTRIIFLLGLLVAMFASCEKDPLSEPTPVAVRLSQTSVSVTAGESVEVTITNGTPGYTVQPSAPAVATATLSGTRITVTGVAAGTATVTVSDAKGEKATLNVTVTAKADLHAAFKQDATSRFEMAGLTVKNNESDLLFYRDEGKLFASGKNKLGYASRNGKELFILEWDGAATAGVKTNPSLRTASGVSSLKSLEIVQDKEGKLWIVAVKPDGGEIKVVQGW